MKSSISVVCGDDDYAVYSYIRDVIKQRKVVIVDDEDSLNDVLSPFYSESGCVHIYGVLVEDFSRVLETLLGSGLRFILRVFGASEAFVKKTDIKVTGFFLPKKYKLEKYAVDFCIDEAKRFGKILGEGTSQILVSVGSNTWFLHHEIMKLSYLADSVGSNKIDRDHVFKIASRLGEYSFDNLIKSIRIRSPQMVSRELNRIEATNVGDPTLRVVRFLSPFISKLVISEYMRSKGKNEDTISEELGLNKWYYVNNVHSGNWNHITLLSVLESLAESERLVLESSVSPWGYLSSRLVSLCLGQQQERR